MKTRTVAFAIALLATTAGCTVDDHASLEVFAICGFPEDAAVCATSGECDTVLAGRPVAVTLFSGGPPAFANQLDLFIQMNNRLPNNADATAGRVNTNDAIIESYEFAFDVRDTFAGPGRTLPFVMSIPDLSYPAVSTIPANGSATPMVPLIPRETMEQIDARIGPDDDGFVVVIVTLRVKGHYESGDEFETAPHEYPVDVFDGIAAAPACPGGEVLVAVCPHIGQTSSFTCEAP